MSYSDMVIITLSGGEQEIEFRHPHNFYHIQNLGSSSIQASLTSGISGRTNGVIEIPSGGSATIPRGKDNKFYTYGSGKINIAASDSNVNPFRNSLKGGGGGGTGVSSYPALTDLPSINGHTLLGDMTSEDLGISGGGSGGTKNYNELVNLPEINNVILKGKLSLTDLGLIVDAILSESSTNPVENRVVRQALIDYLSEAKGYTDKQIANLIDGSETILDTLEKIAQAMKEHEDVVEALDAAIGNKADKVDLDDHIRNYNNPHRVTKENVGLDKVDNTPDAEKDVRSAGKLTTPTTINGIPFDGSEPIEIPAGEEGTTDYDKLENKPSINGFVVSGEVSQEDLGWYELTAKDAERFIKNAFGSKEHIKSNLLRNYENIVKDKISEPDLYFSDEMTIEMCFMYTSIPDKYGRPLDMGAKQSYTEGLFFGTTGTYSLEMGFGRNISDYYNPSNDRSPNLGILNPYTIYTISVAFNQETVSFYRNGKKTADVTPYSTSLNYHGLMGDICINTSDRVSNRDINGLMYSLRIYDRKLSDDEIAYNRTVDQALYHIEEE